MNKLHLTILAALAFVAMIVASPSESDIKQCTDHGQSRETCIHSIMPN